MKLEDVVLNEISQTQKDIKVIHLYNISKIVKLIDTENIIIGCQGLLGEGNVELLYNEYKVLVMQDE